VHLDAPAPAVGRPRTALQTYQECVATLQRELNVGPVRLRDLRERVLGDVSAARFILWPAPDPTPRNFLSMVATPNGVH
jgi:hypothetical protein